MAEGTDRLFREHLAEAFGERAADFSGQLLDRLRKLWFLALETRTGPDMTVRDGDLLLRSTVRPSKETYPVLLDGCLVGVGPSSGRDVYRPACLRCKGTGRGGPSLSCIPCGGSGNDHR